MMQSIGAISSRSQVVDSTACVRHPTVPDKHIPEHAATSIPHGHGHFSEPSTLGTFLGTTHLTSLPKNYEHHPFPLHLSVCLSVSGPSVARHGHLSVRPPPTTGTLNCASYDNPSPGAVEPPDGPNPTLRHMDPQTHGLFRGFATRQRQGTSPTLCPRLPDLFVSPTRYHPRAGAK